MPLKLIKDKLFVDIIEYRIINTLKLKVDLYRIRIKGTN